MSWALLALFVLAGLAVPVHRALPRASGWLLAICPAVIAAYLLAGAPDAAPVRQHTAWMPALGLSLSIFVDGLSRLFGLLVCGIGAIVLVYAGAYMSGHRHLGRLYVLLLLFMGST
jgi:multicomponent Na+:H+ antiporter subunit A